MVVNEKQKKNIFQVTSVPLRSCQLNNMGMNSLCQSEDNAKVVQIKISLFTNCLKENLIVAILSLTEQIENLDIKNELL